MAMVKPGTILGHEGVGIVGEFGPDVRNFSIGDRVVIASTVACGYCSYCRVGYFAQCDQANPKGPHAGTAFFGGPEMTGPFHRLQAEMARIPFANIGMVKLPDEVDDDEAVPLSDIFPTGYCGVDTAEITDGIRWPSLVAAPPANSPSSAPGCSGLAVSWPSTASPHGLKWRSPRGWRSRLQLGAAIDAYKVFDERQEGWIKVKHEPTG
jgi:hypothetical protein